MVLSDNKRFINDRPLNVETASEIRLRGSPQQLLRLRHIQSIVVTITILFLKKSSIFFDMIIT